MVINVVCQKFFRQISYNELTFGLSDLTKPEGPRLRKFLWNMANFWLFCNANFNKVEEVKQRVEEKAKVAKSIRSDVNKMAKERDTLRVEAEKLKISNEQKEKEVKGIYPSFSLDTLNCFKKSVMKFSAL